MREGEAGEAIGKRRLADSLRAADQPTVVHAAAAIRLEQRALGDAIAKPFGPFLGRGPVADLVEARDFGECCRHQAALSNSLLATARQTSSATSSSGCSASMTTQRFGSRRAISR